MSFAVDYLRQLERLAQHLALPRVRALHLPPAALSRGDADQAPTAPGRGEFCALELDDGSVGLSYVLLDDTLPQLRAAACSALAGTAALALAQRAREPHAASKALGLAAANALTHSLYRRAGFRPPRSTDSLGELAPAPGDHVGMIGLFTPLLPALRASGAKVTVIELKPELAGERDGITVTLDAHALRQCNKVLSTGTLVLNDTLDTMLAHAAQASRIALIGPTMGCLPDALFARGVTLLGGTWVNDTAAYLDAMRRGEHRHGLAEKTALTPARYPGFDALLARAAA